MEQEGHTKKYNERGEDGILVQKQCLARGRDDLNCQLIANLKHHVAVLRGFEVTFRVPELADVRICQS